MDKIRFHHGYCDYSGTYCHGANVSLDHDYEHNNLVCHGLDRLSEEHQSSVSVFGNNSGFMFRFVHHAIRYILPGDQGIRLPWD